MCWETHLRIQKFHLKTVLWRGPWLGLAQVLNIRNSQMRHKEKQAEEQDY